MCTHCEMITTSSLAWLVFFFFLVVRILKICSHSKFHIYSTVLLTIVTMLYVRSPVRQCRVPMFRVSHRSFISFLWWCPCSFALVTVHLRKHVPLLVFTNCLWKRKPFISQPIQFLSRLSGGAGGLAAGVLG